MSKATSKMPPGSAWLSREVLTDKNLTGTDLRVYLGLCSYANHDTNETFVSQETLAKELHISRKTVNTSLQKIESLGYIKLSHRMRKTGRGRTTNLYTIVNKTADDQCVNNTLNSEEAANNPDYQCTSVTLRSSDQCTSVTLRKNDDSADTKVKDGVFAASNNNNLNINKNNLKINTNTGEPSNMSKQQSLFTLGSNDKGVTPSQILAVIKEGAAKSLRRIDYVLEGALPESEITELDLCYLYQHLHKEIVGYAVSVNRTQAQSRSGLTSPEYMQRFRLHHDLSPMQAINLFPKMLSEFRALLESEGAKKSTWYLHIGHLTWTGDCYIEKIMRKVKPKVNEKYASPTQATPAANAYEEVDEVF